MFIFNPGKPSSMESLTPEIFLDVIPHNLTLYQKKFRNYG